MAKKGSHAGSFAGGFMEGLLGVMKMEYMHEHYLALQEHYKALDRHYERMADIEERKARNDPNAQAAAAGAAAGANFDSAPVKGEDAGMRDHIVQWANDHGKDPSQALAIWRQESQGGQGLAGDKGPDGAPSSFGDFQFHFGGINPNMPNAGMGEQFLKDTGIDMRKPENYNNADIRYKAADYALNYAAKNDWSPWKKSVEVTRVPNQWANAGRGGATPSLVDASKSINTTGGADATQVHPAFAARVSALSKEAEAATGQPLSFNQVHRTYQQQAEIRARHEAMPGGVHDHPAALPGHSNHEDGTAGDMDNNRAAAYVLTPGPDGKTPLEKHGLQQISDPSTRANDHLHIELPAADKGRTAQAGQRFKPYKVASLGWEPPPESLPSQPPQQGPPQRPPGPSDPSITARGGAGLQDTLLAPPYFFPDMLTRKPYDDTGTVRNPDERNMDPATTAQQAEQAAHYAFVHSGERPSPPPQPQHPASAIPPAPYESGFPPQEDRPQQPQPVVSADRGPPYPPPNVQPPPMSPVTTTEGRPDTPYQYPPVTTTEGRPDTPYQYPPVTTTEGRPDTPPQVMTGRRPEMTTPLAGDQRDERSFDTSLYWNPQSSTPTGMPAPTSGRVPEMMTPTVGERDERLQPAAAGQPAVASHPDVAPQAGAGAIPTRPGWGVIDRPNMDAISGPYHTGSGPSGGPASMGAFDFSTLWRPNPPLPAKGAAPAASVRPPPPAPRPAIAPTPYPNGPRLNPSGNLVVNQPGQEERSVPVPLPPPRPTEVVVKPPPPVPSPAVTDAPDKPIVPPAAQTLMTSRDEDAEEGIMAQDEAATQLAMMSPEGALGVRKGGAIPRRPTLGYAAGGGVTGYAAGATVTSQQVQQALDNALYGPNAPYSRNDIMYGRPDQTLADMYNANFNALTPEQQTWYNAQQAALGGYQGAMQAQGASYTAPTGERGGQGSTVNQGQLALAGNQLSYYQGLFDPNMPAAAAPAAAAPAADTTPAVVTPTVDPTLSQLNSAIPNQPSLTTDTSSTGGTVTGITDVPNTVAPTAVDPTTSATTDTTASTATVKPLKTPSTLAPSSPGSGEDIGATDTTKKSATDVSAASGAYAGFRGGGAIPPRPPRRGYAAGGGVMGYASGGAPTSAMLASPGWQNTASTYTTGPDTAPLTNQQLYDLQNTINAQPAGMFMGSYSDWLTGANNSQNPAGASRDLTNYYGAWSAPAPAVTTPAPTPVAPTVTPVTTTDTTTTLDNNTSSGGGTVTGITGLPDVVTPTTTSDTTTTPAVDPTTSSTTTTDAGDTTTKPLNTPSTLAKSTPGVTDTGATDTAKKSTDVSDTSGAYAGFRRGGVIGHNGAMRYDDGGGVSPSPMGMPPGLAGGQGQPIPPVYFNPATYAGAGAPIGKGITNTSAPTYVAGAIPSLPMFRGGVVKGYALGGDVGEEMPDASGDVGDDDYAGMGGSTTGAPSGADYRADADVISGGRSGVEPSQPIGGAAPPTQQPQQGPPPGAPPWTPQVNDGQGNPSRGLIGAISGGLHFIAHFVGLDGGGQEGAIATDPSSQMARQRLASGQSVDGSPLPTRNEYTTQIPQAIGADGLHEGLKTLASMEAIHNFWIQHGDMAKADGYAAGMIQTSIQLARDYGAEAVKRYYNGDLKGAVDAMNQSKDVIADGTIVKATVNPDGKTVHVAGKDLNGETLWQQVVAPQAILGAALKTADGSLPWHMYEIAAAKYDPQTKAIIDARTQSRQTDQANEEIAGFGPTSVARTRDWGGGVTPGVAPAMTAPRPAQQPTVRPPPQSAGGPGVPGLTPPAPTPGMEVAQADATRGGAATGAGGDRAPPATPPVGADTQNAPTLLPPGPPTREAADAGANQPAPQAEEVSFETEQATKAQIRQNAHANYWTPEGNPWVNGQEIPKPQPIDQASFNKLTPQVQKVWSERNTAYIEASKYAQAQEDKEYTAKAGDYDNYLKDQRATATAGATEARAEKGRVAQGERDIKLKNLEATNKVLADQYADLMTRERPYTDEENNKKLGVDGSGVTQVYTHLAAAFLPEANRTTIANDRDAISALANAKLGASNMDPATLRTIGSAFKTASMYSTQTPVEEVARGVMLLASGHKTPDDAPAVLNKRLGTYDITVIDDNGSAVHLSIPVSEALNLYAIGNRVRQEAEDARVSAVTKEGESQGWPTPPQPALPGIGGRIQQTLPDLFPRFKPGESPGEVIYRNLPSIPGGNPFTRETPPLRRPPPPDR